MSAHPINTLDELYAALEPVCRDIAQDCPECKDPDCMGYIWLLDEEVQRLSAKGVSPVQINDGPTFLPWTPLDGAGLPDITARYPSCGLLCKDARRCSIHEYRPFVCRLYPVGFETEEDGTIVWATHLDCLHIRRLEERGTLSVFEDRVGAIIDNISPALLKEIITAYRAVDAISEFPDGGNRYKVLRRYHHE